MAPAAVLYLAPCLSGVRPAMGMCHEYGTSEAGPPKERRRRWTAADKLRIVAETLQPGMSVGRVARRYELAHHLLRRWRRLANRGALDTEANRRCALCDEPFEASRSDARFCSSKCRQRAYRLHRSSHSA